MKEKARLWLRDNHFVPLITSGLMLAVGSGLLTSALILAVVLMSLGVVVGTYGERLGQAGRKARSDLVSEIAELETVTDRFAANSSDAVASWLEAFAAWADLDSEARVSLYSLTDSGWRRVGRYSKNLLYVGGRTEISSGHGVLTKAHLTGEFAVDNLPSFAEDPESYFLEQRQLGVTKGICRDFTMRTRSYAGFGFGRGNDRTRPYVLIFESTDANGLDSESLRQLIHVEARQGLATLSELEAISYQLRKKSSESPL